MYDDKWYADLYIRIDNVFRKEVGKIPKPSNVYNLKAAALAGREISKIFKEERQKIEAQLKWMRENWSLTDEELKELE